MPTVGYATLQVIPSVRGIANELRQQLVGPAEQAGERAGEQSGGGFKDAFKGALAALGVEAIAEKAGEAFTEAFSAAIEQGDVTKHLKAQLGASQADADRYGKLVGQLYTSGVTGEFAEGAETIRALVSTGLVPPDATNKQLTSIATHMQDVATTFGTDMTLQTQSVSALLKNKLAPDADSALDVITKGFQKLGPAGEDVLETFQEYPVQLRKLGLDAKTSLGLFSQGLQGGARDTDIVADALKEFSIRSIDMSATSQTAYKQLGLSAKDMSLQIAKGGKGASDGLQTVLDKLRGIKDPVQQEAAAVGLFGTQAEDLGAALFNLDPSKATSAIGDVSGAATQLGDDLRSGPSYEITVFKRALQQKLVGFIGGKVLPILGKWGGVLDDDVLPPLEAVGGVAEDVLVPAVRDAGKIVQGTYKWFKKWGVFLTPLAVLVGGVALALGAEAIATGIAAGATATWATVTGIATGVTEGWAAAQALLNSVLALNPIVLVVIALAALAAALVVAYQKSETFRDIVQGAWLIIKFAAMGVINWFTGTFLPFFTETIPGAFQAVISWVTGHWPLLLGIITGPLGLAAFAIYHFRDQIIGAFRAAWSWINTNVLSPMKTFFTKTLPGWAESAVSGFGREWDKLEGRAKKPINFVINTVYNHGIVGVWNKVAGAFGAPKLGTFQFASGGPVFGAGTETSDDVPAWLSRGEHVWTAREVRGAGGHGAVAAMRAWAAAGGGTGSPGFALGGAFDWIGSGIGAVVGAGSAAWKKAKQAVSWIKDTALDSVRAGVRAVVNPLLNRIPGLDTGWGRMMRDVPGRMVDTLLGAASGYDSGGWLAPGATMAVNATRQPEAVLTASQWRAVAAAAAAAQAVAVGASRYQPAAQQRPVIYLTAAGLDRGLLQWLQRAVRDEGGGSVQVLLGPPGKR